MTEPHSSTFRVITTNYLGFRIFREFTVHCFPFHCHLLDTLLHAKTHCSNFGVSQLIGFYCFQKCKFYLPYCSEDDQSSSTISCLFSSLSPAQFPETKIYHTPVYLRSRFVVLVINSIIYHWLEVSQSVIKDDKS